MLRDALDKLTSRERRKWWKSSRRYFPKVVHELAPVRQLYCPMCGFPAWELTDNQRSVKVGKCTESTCEHTWEWKR